MAALKTKSDLRALTRLRHWRLGGQINILDIDRFLRRGWLKLPIYIGVDIELSDAGRKALGIEWLR